MAAEIARLKAEMVLLRTGVRLISPYLQDAPPDVKEFVTWALSSGPSLDVAPREI